MLLTRADGPALTVVAAILLSGCMGSSGGSSSSPPPGGGGGGGGGLPGETFDAHDPEAVAMDSRVADMSATPAMPTSGQARYDGYAFIEMSETGQNVRPGDAGYEAVLGQMALSADFASGGVTGRIHNVGVEEGPTLSGQLDISEGRLTGNGLTGKVSGTLTGSDMGDVTADLGMDGRFRGNDADAVVGGFTGDVMFGNGQNRVVGGDSGFVAERTP